MRKLLTLAVFGLTLAAGYSVASDHGTGKHSPRDQWLPLDQVEDTLRLQGYEVREIETDDDYYEVEAIDADGRRVEAYVDPLTGKIIKVERDD